MQMGFFFMGADQFIFHVCLQYFIPIIVFVDRIFLHKNSPLFSFIISFLW